MDKPIYIIGHQHPDTDSVCSAIAYAYLKKQMGWNVEPARAGKLNPETVFALEYFHIPAPRLINYFYPSLEDIKLLQAPAVGVQATLRDVGKLFVENPRLKSVPVLDEEENVVGIITVGDLAKRYYEEESIKELEHGSASFANIVDTLEGRLLCGDINKTFSGKIKLGASRVSTILSDVAPGDMIILGDREDAQKELLGLGHVCLVLTRNTRVSEDIIRLAEEKDGVIIVTPFDSYRTARLINQSIPVSLVMTSPVVCFNVTDQLSDVKEKILSAKYVTYPVLRKGKYIGIIDRGMMLEPEWQQVILVDHNERSQAVEGIEETQILEIIDHHRLGGLTTGAPIYIRQEPVGSTATIIANMMWNLGYGMPPKIAGILFAAMVSDTLYFRSPTTTETDRAAAKRLAVQAGIEDPEDFAMQLLRAGSVLNTMAPADIIRNDFKEFDFGDVRVTVSQINIMDRQLALEKLPELQEALDAFRLREKYTMSLLMVTDVLGEATDLLESGNRDGVLDLAFGQREEAGYYHLPGVLSRKKQVIPPLTEAFKKVD
ncbi:MAG: putative manganese-dependent inorganic diphosphatase [Acidaminococcaceae bacterium]|nr:putative manganese-dependent inorganic diphosphatase [Acidaminococcaceae bacterium]